MKWQLWVDLGRQLRFPDIITATTLRLDMVLVSTVSKQVVVLELTVPWEDRMEKAQESKRAKYAKCWRNRWKACCESTEVGCSDFAGNYLHRLLGLLGIFRMQRVIKNILEAAEKASRWLWLRKGEAWHSALSGYKSRSYHSWLGRPGEDARPQNTL